MPNQNNASFRIGIGYDIHKLVSGRPLMLGGMQIAFDKGLIGHSDADVLLHAVCDALLGAAGMGDIGRHFPDSDPQYCGISGLELLRRTMVLIKRDGWMVNNIDATLFAQAPKLEPYKHAMEQRVAGVLDINPGVVNFKATTTEQLGVIGRGQAMAAMCVAMIESVNPGGR